jgi:transcriptional regulator with XRE-family HTH domain
VQPASREATRLARRLRQLREQQWQDARRRLTQKDVADALSVEGQLAAATVSSWESTTAPKLPPPHRLRAYARFFATRRSIEGPPRLLQVAELTADELAVCERLETELLELRKQAADDPPEEEVAVSGSSWQFTDSSLITLVCAKLPDNQTGPLGAPINPNYTELQTFADADALTELFGHIRAENPHTDVHFKTPSEVGHDDLTGHLILIGGVVWNEITEELSEMARLPVRQFSHPDLNTGEIFIIDEDGKDQQQFWPKWKNKERTLLGEDVGLLARVPHPLASNRTLTICNGIHSRGVYGAVRSLTDTHVRDVNERYLAAHFGNSSSFAILMSVKVINNKAITPDFNIDGVVRYRWPPGTAS